MAAGTFKPAFVRQGLGKMLTIAPFGPAVTPETKTAVLAAADKVEKGFTPFTGPVADNTGVVRIKAGETLGGDKMGSLDWYAEGVIGKAK